MKKYYIFFLITIVCTLTYAQTPCSDTQPDIGYAYGHAKSAYDSNNLTQLKRFAARSLEAFRRVDIVLKSCNCEDAYYESLDAMEALTKIASINVYEDARFYIKRAREHAKQTIAELEECTKWSSEDHALAELHNEQQKLEEQRKALQAQEELIKGKLAQQKQKELSLKREKLIAKNESALKNNMTSFNEMLSACGCDSRLSESDFGIPNVVSNDIEQIKTHYLNKVKQMTTSYLMYLNQCSIK